MQITNIPDVTTALTATGTTTATSTTTDTTSMESLRGSFQTLLNYAIDGVAKNSSSEAAKVSDLDPIFTKAAQTYGLDKNLLLAIGYHESRFIPTVTSSKGAMGIMQLMPGTAAQMGVQDAYDPEQNIMGAAKLLDTLLDKYNGDTRLALAAYSMGTAALSDALGTDGTGSIPSSVETIISDIASLSNQGSALLTAARKENADTVTSTASTLKAALTKFSGYNSYNLFMSEFQKVLNDAKTADTATGSTASNGSISSGTATNVPITGNQTTNGSISGGTATNMPITGNQTTNGSISSGVTTPDGVVRASDTNEGTLGNTGVLSYTTSTSGGTITPSTGIPSTGTETTSPSTGSAANNVTTGLSASNVTTDASTATDGTGPAVVPITYDGQKELLEQVNTALKSTIARLKAEGASGATSNVATTATTTAQNKAAASTDATALNSTNSISSTIAPTATTAATDDGETLYNGSIYKDILTITPDVVEEIHNAAPGEKIIRDADMLIILPEGENGTSTSTV